MTSKDRPAIQERFEAFLAEHPDVYTQFVDISMQLLRRGHRRYSADGVGHIVRWHRITSGVDAEGFKLNNVFTSRLARKAMAEVPELAGFFETRRLKRV